MWGTSLGAAEGSEKPTAHNTKHWADMGRRDSLRDQELTSVAHDVLLLPDLMRS